MKAEPDGYRRCEAQIFIEGYRKSLRQMLPAVEATFKPDGDHHRSGIEGEFAFITGEMPGGIQGWGRKRQKGSSHMIRSQILRGPRRRMIMKYIGNAGDGMADELEELGKNAPGIRMRGAGCMRRRRRSGWWQPSRACRREATPPTLSVIGYDRGVLYRALPLEAQVSAYP